MSTKKHPSQNASEFWVIFDLRKVRGPYSTMDSAKGSLEDYEIVDQNTRIAETRVVAEKTTVTTTEWK